MADYPEIKTPRGEIMVMGTGGEAKAFLLWNPNLKEKYTELYFSAQRFVDSEVLRLCEPYVPLRTGMLIQSGILGTEIGSGYVKWIAPYARAQYYGARKPGSGTGPLRGPQWFERMKAVSGAAIVAGAKAIFAATGGAIGAQKLEAERVAVKTEAAAFRAWKREEIRAGRLKIARGTRKPKPVSIPGVGPRKLRKSGGS